MDFAAYARLADRVVELSKGFQYRSAPPKDPTGWEPPTEKRKTWRKATGGVAAAPSVERAPKKRRKAEEGFRPQHTPYPLDQVVTKDMERDFRAEADDVVLRASRDPDSPTIGRWIREARTGAYVQFARDYLKATHEKAAEHGVTLEHVHRMAALRLGLEAGAMHKKFIEEAREQRPKRKRR
jgi:hypothetical protein